MKHDSIGTRMKENYESITKFKLMKRCPTIIRVDGVAFHTLTRDMDKPFDKILVKTMQDTMKYLCENIQGCVLGYTQSDEITLVLVDYANLNSSAWFDNEVLKMASVSASMATLAFNKHYFENVSEMTEDEESFKRYARKFNQAYFDSRVFNVPKEEVTNCIFWRQLDAERNSKLSVAQAHYRQIELQGKACREVIDMLEKQNGIIWDNLPTTLKRGSCCVRHNGWTIDDEIPRFVEGGREYIDRLVFLEDDE